MYLYIYIYRWKQRLLFSITKFRMGTFSSQFLFARRNRSVWAVGLKGPEKIFKIQSLTSTRVQNSITGGEILLKFSRNWFPDVSYLPSQSCDVCRPHYQIARGSHEGRLHLAMMMMMVMMMVLLAKMIQIVMILSLNDIIILVIRVTLIVGLPPRLTSFWIVSSQILHFLPAWLAGLNN